MVKIIWTDIALNDLKDIFDYISKDSKRYAKEQIRRIKSKTSTLKKNPKIGRIVPETANSQIREVFEKKYRIIYRNINDQTIEILTIHHSARHFEEMEID
jgi:toxin ParE1/3/4